MTPRQEYTTDDLINMNPIYDAFVGIDSDGCVFDTMEIKQKQCFHPLIISHWDLQPIDRYVREAAEFVNLYSKWRGRNRFPCLLMSIDLLRDRPEVLTSEVTLPSFSELRSFVDSGLPLGNPSLQQQVEQSGNEELASVLKWSMDVNAEIAKVVTHVPPFPWALKSLARIQERADAIVVSQTPAEALLREWSDNDLVKYVHAIAGQELGKKSEHLKLAAVGKYPPGRILMIGDAPGDMKAAKDNNALFYPINPGHEDDSWRRFHEEAFDKFLSGSFAGAYEQGVIEEFQALLPETPPWTLGE